MGRTSLVLAKAHPDRRSRTGPKRAPATALGILLATSLVACTAHPSGSRTEEARSTSSRSSSERIPQPSLAKLNKRTRRRLAPPRPRIDLIAPVFSHPTKITNPLFPISNLRSVVLVGKLHGKPWRAETTLLPNTTTVEWNGRRIETLRSQFVAYLDGRIFEVAVDRYAQADDGSVWYLGEDAVTYERGHAVDTEGTWLAGTNGPPALIMPGHPHLGDVYRTENIPGLVFEQVTVKALNRTVDGPIGPIHGAMIGQELHMDEARLENKVFAPGYGELVSGGGSTFEANALAVPIDALGGPVPAALQSLNSQATALLDRVGSRMWSGVRAGERRVTDAWNSFRGGAVPPRLEAEMNGALDALRKAVGNRAKRKVALAALEVAQASLNLELRYRPAAEIDTARLELWARQLESDAAAGDPSAVAGDINTLEWIRDRIPLTGSAASRVDDQLRYLRAAADARELAAVTTAAQQLASATIPS